MAKRKMNISCSILDIQLLRRSNDVRVLPNVTAFPFITIASGCPCAIKLHQISMITLFKNQSSFFSKN